MSRLGLRLGPPGYVCFLILSLALAIAARGWRVALACAVVLVLSAVFFPGGLVPLRSRRLWLFLALLLVSALLFLGPERQSGDPLLSQAGLAAGLEMVLRALAIVVAVSGFSTSMSVSDLSQLLERAGLRGLGFALGVAFNMLPTIQNGLTTAYQALILRGGFRRRPLLGLRLLLVTVVANSLRHAEDIVGSAEARAFSPDKVRIVPMPWQRGDLAVTGILMAALLAVWLI